MGKPVLVWQNVSCFLRPPVTSQNIASIYYVITVRQKLKKKTKKKKTINRLFFLVLIRNKNVVKTGESWGCLAAAPYTVKLYIARCRFFYTDGVRLKLRV